MARYKVVTTVIEVCYVEADSDGEALDMVCQGREPDNVYVSEREASMSLTVEDLS